MFIFAGKLEMFTWFLARIYRFFQGTPINVLVEFNAEIQK